MRSVRPIIAAGVAAFALGVAACGADDTAKAGDKAPAGVQKDGNRFIINTDLYKGRFGWVCHHGLSDYWTIGFVQRIDKNHVELMCQYNGEDSGAYDGWGSWD
jgi:hypothetical protein